MTRNALLAAKGDRHDSHEHKEQIQRLTVRLRAQGLDKYPAKSHARRVAEKLGVQQGVIVLSASESALYPGSDNKIPFRQERYFYYLSGCNEPNCFLSYEIGSDTLTLWLPPIDKARVVWVGRGSTVEEALTKYDIDDAKYIPAKSDQCLSRVPGWNDHNAIITTWIAHTVIPVGLAGRGSVYLLDGQICRHALVDLSSLRTAMNACRVIKDGHEIDLIRKANQITSEAHVNVMRNLHAYRNEAEVEAAYMQTCIARHAKEQAYAPIAGSGSNGSVLHYDKNEANFRDGQTIVIDAGCEVSCYASDVTRTLPLNTKEPGHWPSKEAEQIYSLVEKVQETCIKQLRPGNSFLSITWLSRCMIVEGLLELGILKGKVDDILHAGTYVGFYPHGLGHHVGLEVHDVSPNPHPPMKVSDFTPREDTESDLKRLCPAWTAVLDFSNPAQLSKMLLASKFDTSCLKAGMVVTIEPGVYFNNFLLKEFFLDHPVHSQYIDKEVLKRFMPVGGVRIEDNVLITKNGFENLTTTPKGKYMLKIIKVGAEHVTGLPRAHEATEPTEIPAITFKPIFIYDDERLQRVVEEAVSRAIAAGRPDLAAAVHEIYLTGLKDNKLRALLDMILARVANQEQTMRFREYVKVAKKKLNDAKIAKEVYDHQRLKPIVEAGVLRAHAQGKHHLAGTVHQLHSKSLHDEKLRVLLEAMCTQAATEEQIVQFKEYCDAHVEAQKAESSGT